MIRSGKTFRAAILALLLLSFSVTAFAIQKPTETKPSFRDPSIYIPNFYERASLSAIPDAVLNGAALSAFGGSLGTTFYDIRGGRWATLLVTYPLVTLNGNQTEAQLQSAAASAFTAFLQANAGLFELNTSELSTPRVQVMESGNVIQIFMARQHQGVTMRQSYANATINHGKLVLLNFKNWGPVSLNTTPAVTANQALTTALTFAGPTATGTLRQPYLAIQPLAPEQDLTQVLPGQGYEYRLVWVVTPVLQNDRSKYEALVDAQSGTLLLFHDTNQYASRSVLGGVYPVSNDGQSPNGIPDGVEQPGYPFPYADVLLPDNSIDYTTSGGVLGCVNGSITTKLQGKYVVMNDTCGLAVETSAAGNLDLGASSGTDCVVPAGHSAGDTHASRSGYYELNRLIEQARGWLPTNSWLHGKLPSNMNINDTCNAFWDGGSVNFYRSGGGCNNTGEIAAIFDHEWGHGMDDNDTNGIVSTPGESLADIYAFLRLRTSCIGRGFQNTACDGYGDTCTSCTGVRDIDYSKHASGTPHDLAWIMSPWIPLGGCVGLPSTNAQFGPCNQETHCEGVVPAEAVYDFVTRKLTSPPFNLSLSNAGELGTRLTYLGSGNVDNWYQCNPANPPVYGDGCNGDGGYLNYLTADDDDGNILNGTPHMTALYDAFNDHAIACNVPVTVNSGCAVTPAQAPTLSIQPADQAAHLSWTASPGATKYWIFRGEGVHGCTGGKVRVGETTTTSFIDEGLTNDFTYYYSVVPIGTTDACVGTMSSCVTMTPEAGSNLKIKENSVQLSIVGGDSDELLDNCEAGDVEFTVNNSGITDLTNVRIQSVDSISHPSIQITTSLPATIAARLAECEDATGNFTFAASGLSYNDTVKFDVTVTADEIFPRTRTLRMEFVGAESDFSALTAQRTFTFEAGNEDWSLVSGTFNRTNGVGGNATTWYYASSAALDGQCDRIQSPLLKLNANSEVGIWTQYTTEPFSGTWFDRANLGILDVTNNAKRTTVVPDGGLNPYLASGPGGACVTSGEPGWAGAGGWGESTFSSTALQTSTFANKLVKLDVAYATDPAAAAAGFWFDEVTVKNFQYQIADPQSNSCGPRIAIENKGIAEGNSGSSMASFKVTLTQTSGSTVSVDYTTSAGTATAGTDFTNIAGTLNIPSGETFGIIDVPVNGDTLSEPDETFFVNLMSPVNATISDAQGRGDILDDDFASLSIEDAAFPEGNGGNSNRAFRVNLSSILATDVTFQYMTSDGTAQAGRDYVASSGVVTIPAGDSFADILIPVTGDTLLEPDETFFVTISNASAGILDEQAQGTIQNDETGSPQIVFDSITMNDAVGNNNNNVDPNECVSFVVAVKNTGASTATNVTATLTTGTSNTSMALSNSPYPDIAPAAVENNLFQFRLQTTNTFVCGTPINFTMQVTTAQGVFTFPVSYSGGSTSSTSFNSTLPTPIPDGVPVGIDSNISVAAITGPIARVSVSMYISHTWVEDLDVSLVGPDGTTVILTTDNGGDADNYGMSCPASDEDTNFDDNAAVLISNGAAPFSGFFRPQQPLSAFAGKSGTAVNGTWKLHVVDDTLIDNGTIQCWKLTITTATCAPGSGACSNLPLPGEVPNVKWASGNDTQLTWDPANLADWYNVYEGLSQDLGKVATSETDSCRRWTGSGTNSNNTLLQTPEPGKFFWYLVRGQNGAGEGTAGNTSTSARIHDSNGPCP